MATASLAFIVRQIDAQLTIPLQFLTNLVCPLPKPGGGERPIVLQSLLHVLWSCCHADSIRAWDARGSGTLRSEGAVLCSLRHQCTWGTCSDWAAECGMRVAVVDLNVHLA